MSGQARHAARLNALADCLPPDVPVLEFQDWRCALRTKGMAILPWRGAWLDARQGSVNAQPQPPLDNASWQSALVHVQKGRAATEADLATAWSKLAVGGFLHLLGTNDLGVVSYARRLGHAIDQTGERLATGGHGRLLRFVRTEHSGPPSPAACSVPSHEGSDALTLATAPGVFSRDELDEGTSLLVNYLREQPPVGSVFDLGCGAGHLAIAALQRWEKCHATLVDADARAIECANTNLASLGFAARAETHWWCERDALPAHAMDLTVINPPCHAGSELDIYQAEQLLAIGFNALAPHGRMLVVANRQLPYESILGRLGTVSCVRQQPKFKILEVTRVRTP